MIIIPADILDPSAAAAVAALFLVLLSPSDSSAVQVLGFRGSVCVNFPVMSTRSAESSSSLSLESETMDGLVITADVNCGDDDNDGIEPLGFDSVWGLDLLLVGSSAVVSSRESIFFRLLRRGSNGKALLSFRVEVESDVPLPPLLVVVVLLLLLLLLL